GHTSWTASRVADRACANLEVTERRHIDSAERCACPDLLGLVMCRSRQSSFASLGFQTSAAHSQFVPQVLFIDANNRHCTGSSITRVSRALKWRGMIRRRVVIGS